ncbi:MAG TPA: glycosyltransferase [Humisphaera sp.]
MVSVILPVFNAESYLAEAVDSVLSQSLRDFELIAVDDGSGDGSGRLLDEFARRDGRVRVIHQRNLGLGWAPNRAAAEARGKYLARMDADDVAVPDRLERQAAYLDANPEVVVVGGAIELFGCGTPVVRHYPETDAEIRSMIDRVVPFGGPAVMMRTAAFRRVGGYRPAFNVAEDYDLWFRMSEQGQLANLPEVVLRSRRHLRQSTRNHRNVIVCAMAARISARHRREYGVDPLGTAHRVTAELLYPLGLSERDVQWGTVQGHLDQAYEQAMLGLFDEAVGSAELADEAAQLPEVRREFAHKIAAAYARYCYRRRTRELPRSVWHAARAVLLKLGARRRRRRGAVDESASQ